MPNRPISQRIIPSVGQIGSWLMVVNNGEVLYAEEINEINNAVSSLENFLVNNISPIKIHNELQQRNSFPSHEGTSIKVDVTNVAQSILNQVTGVIQEGGKKIVPLQNLLNWIMTQAVLVP